MAKTLTFVTGNKQKLLEVMEIVTKLSGDAPFPYDLVSKKIDLPELQGEPEKIAIEKARLAAKEVGTAVLVEDTSLHFNALNGLPGPYIKWFLEKIGHVGLNNMLAAYADKSAYAQVRANITLYSTYAQLCFQSQCTFGFLESPESKVGKVFTGKTNGKIVSARGPKTFGWDPVFEPKEGHGKTYAEMLKKDKNAISHRYRALKQFCEWIQSDSSSSKEE